MSAPEEHGVPAELCVLGVMTGTSCDALDAVCVSFHEEGWDLLWTERRSYPARLRSRVLDFQKPHALHSAREFLGLERDLGEWYGRALKAIIHKRRAGSRIDVVANHGQTVAHFPEARRKGMTLQCGDPARIAWWTGLTVLSDFRRGDMSAGGEGAPLVPLFHKMLVRKMGLEIEEEGVVLQNIGGIGNLTYVGPRDTLLAFDTGPGNSWIDAAVAKATRGRKRMDVGGRLAARGVVDGAAVQKMLRHPFFRKPPPKSTGRDEFPVSFFLSCVKHKRTPDLIATATAVTVESIAAAYRKWILEKGLPLKRVFLCGGGARNLFLVESLKKKFPDLLFGDLRCAGVSPDFLEAEAFAFLGFLSLMGQALGGEWTGAGHFGPPASVTPGANWRSVVQKLAEFFRH